MFLARVYCVVRQEVAEELIERTGQNHLDYLLLFSVHDLRIEQIDLDICIFAGFEFSDPLDSVKVVLALSGEYIAFDGFLLPESIDKLESIVVLEARKDKNLLFLGQTFNVIARNAEGMVGHFGDLRDTVDMDGCFFDDSEHVGDEHQMLLAYVEPTKERKVHFKDALVVLKDCLVRYLQFLTNN
jgi:hypothetical protein